MGVAWLVADCGGGIPSAQSENASSIDLACVCGGNPCAQLECDASAMRRGKVFVWDGMAGVRKRQRRHQGVRQGLSGARGAVARLHVAC